MPNGYSIADIERSTGISRETLRIWERRYGFPAPGRTATGDRSFSAAELERLRLIKRLLDQGYRPGKVVPMPAVELAQLERASPASEGALAGYGRFDPFFNLLRQASTQAASEWLRNRLVEDGLRLFLHATLAPLTEAVGDAWAAGRLQVHDEHLFAELAQRLLRSAIGDLSGGADLVDTARPYVLLTTLPDELHSLGLLMAEARLTLDGARCLNLGVNTPIPEMVAAVRHHQIDALALSFSLAYPRRRVASQLVSLRAALPPDCELWAGGRATTRLRSIPGVRYCPKLEDASKLVQQWCALGPGRLPK